MKKNKKGYKNCSNSLPLVLNPYYPTKLWFIFWPILHPSLQF